MDRDELTVEECKATWREEARARAVQEAKDQGLHGGEAEAHVQRGTEEIYAELEKIGLENL
jgi:hypothetical protein